jgi:hypothetical protein
MKYLVLTLNIALMIFWIVLISEGIKTGLTLHLQGTIASSLTFSNFFKTAFPLVGLIISSAITIISVLGIYDWHKARNTI